MSGLHRLGWLVVVTWMFQILFCWYWISCWYTRVFGNLGDFVLCCVKPMRWVLLELIWIGCLGLCWPFVVWWVVFVYLGWNILCWMVNWFVAQFILRVSGWFWFVLELVGLCLVSWVVGLGVAFALGYFLCSLVDWLRLDCWFFVARVWMCFVIRWVCSFRGWITWFLGLGIMYCS